MRTRTEIDASSLLSAASQNSHPPNHSAQTMTAGLAATGDAALAD
jgi:hypothetical protein